MYYENGLVFKRCGSLLEKACLLLGGKFRYEEAVPYLCISFPYQCLSTETNEEKPPKKMLRVCIEVTNRHQVGLYTMRRSWNPPTACNHSVEPSEVHFYNRYHSICSYLLNWIQFIVNEMGLCDRCCLRFLKLLVHFECTFICSPFIENINLNWKCKYCYVYEYEVCRGPHHRVWGQYATCRCSTRESFIHFQFFIRFHVAFSVRRCLSSVFMTTAEVYDIRRHSAATN